MLTHVFRQRKHSNGSLEKSCGECCGSTVLTAVCYWSSSDCIPARKFVSVRIGRDKSQPITVGIVLRRWRVLSPLFYIVCIWGGETVTAEWTRVPLLEAAGPTVCSLQTIWCCLNPLNRVFNMHLIVFVLRAIKWDWKLDLKGQGYYLSRNPNQCVLNVSFHVLQQVERFKYLGMVFTSNERRKK